MYNGYFIKAMNDEFYRVFPQFDRRASIITAIESGYYADFCRMYLCGPLRG